MTGTSNGTVSGVVMLWGEWDLPPELVCPREGNFCAAATGALGPGFEHFQFGPAVTTSLLQPPDSLWTCWSLEMHPWVSRQEKPQCTQRWNRRWPSLSCLLQCSVQGAAG